VYVRHDSDEPGSTGIRISPSGRRRAGSTATSLHEEFATVVLTRDAIEERSGNGAA
jgi:hypothetical protein